MIHVYKSQVFIETSIQIWNTGSIHKLDGIHLSLRNHKLYVLDPSKHDTDMWKVSKNTMSTT